MTLNILHVHSSFDRGGKELRAARLMNAFGARARHTVLSSMPGALAARTAIEPGIDVALPDTGPPLTGRPSVARYQAIARYMRRFDLVLTYNWGAIDAVLARRMFARELPPLVHHEDGFNTDEQARLKTERNLLRRLALPAAHALVVPSRTLVKIARRSWKQPDARVVHIANGIDVARYAEKPKAGALPGFKRRAGEIVIGSIAGLREVKDLPRLVRAFATLPAHTRLVIVGDGPERGAIEAEAARLGVVDRVHLPGHQPDPHRYIGLLDIVALSSRSEQAPIAVIEAMAAGLPVVAPDVGDVQAMVSPANAEFIAESETELRQALETLVGSDDLRREVGSANRLKATDAFDENRMIAAYTRLYSEAAGRPGALGD